MILFQNVSKIYWSTSGPITALQDISFEIEPKEFVSIIGRSGAGKTTLFKLLLALEKPTKGLIFFEGQDISKIKPTQLPWFRRKIGVIFQDYKLLFSKTVYENIAYVMEIIGAKDSEIVRSCREALEIVELEDKAHNFPNELSSGEQQRLVIARAICHQPQVILADEPTGNLDFCHTQNIIQLLKKINEIGTTVILATHSPEIINNIGKRVITLEEGRLVRDDKNGKFIL